MPQKQSMNNEKARYQQNYSLENEICMKNSGLYWMESQKKWGYCR